MSNAKKDRKRRSFWEPDSKKVVDWINSQTDLGTSLQLIIVDAMHKYGDGDVIKAHLNQREQYPGQEIPMTGNTATSRPESLDVPSMDMDDRGAESEEPVLSSFSEPEGAEGSDRDAESEIELDSGSVETNENDDDAPFDIDTLTREEDPKEKEAEYDPLSIMMQDIGSTYNK
ncbi:hypothetical protein RKD55_004736 [Rossellomorea marisflavi]